MAEILDRIGHRPATALRLAGLVAFIYWQLTAIHPAGLHGRGLVISILLTLAGIAWAGWTITVGERLFSERGLSWDVGLLALAGGLLVGISPEGPGNVFVFVAAFTAGARAGIPRGLVITATAIIALSVSWIVFATGGLGALAYALGLVATTFGGAQRLASVQAREQAELLLAQTQRSHQEQLRAARLEESGRIAREIHDVLAHALAGLTIQLEATTALVEAGAGADTVLPRLRQAHALARQGLAETRLAVGALRDGSDGAGADTPAVARIEALVTDHRSLGHAISLDVSGDLTPLSGPAGAAAVRIVQESLTNVTKHAPGADITVRLSGGPPPQVSVENSGGATAGPLAASGGGYGIGGMRERAEALGGQLDVGPTPSGWRVAASLGARP